MRNALLPSYFFSHPHSFGNNEVQIPNLEVSMQVDRQVDVNGSGFSMESALFNNNYNQLRGGGYATPYQSLVEYKQGYHFGSSSSDHDISQQSLLLNRNSFYQDLLNIQSATKRAINDDVLAKKGIETASDELKTNKKVKVASSLEQDRHDQLKQATKMIKENRMPVRRSQKLSDKITALQKLVSPYGKTDTASVLQEASLYIKLLQEQIQNLFHMQSSSYNSTATTLHPNPIQEIGEIKQVDLRSKGLCLVPISFSQKVTNEDLSDPHTI